MFSSFRHITKFMATAWLHRLDVTKPGWHVIKIVAIKRFHVKWQNNYRATKINEMSWQNGIQTIKYCTDWKQLRCHTLANKCFQQRQRNFNPCNKQVIPHVTRLSTLQQLLHDDTCGAVQDVHAWINTRCTRASVQDNPHNSTHEKKRDSKMQVHHLVTVVKKNN